MEDGHNWSAPVVLANSEAEAFVVVRNSVEAAAYLMQFWPQESGMAFARALLACAEALEGASDDEEARNAFLAAAHEARIAITIH